MRCFVACFLTRPSAARLVSATPPIPGCRPVVAPNLHVTLHFLGELDGPVVPEVQAFVAGLDGAPTQARVLDLTGFPRPERARAVVATLAVDDHLETWQQRLIHGWPTGETRRFRPHVTLGRARMPVSVPRVEALAGLEIDLEPPALYRSETLPEGVRYSKLETSV